MKLSFLLAAIVLLALSANFSSCGNSAEQPTTLCDTICNKDSINFITDNKAKSVVNISVKNCVPDSISWGHELMSDRIMSFETLAGETVNVNPKFVRSSFKDTSYVWLVFNDCANGQGYIVRLPFNEKEDVFRKNSGINSFDPKYSVAENLVAYTDRGNIFVEDVVTGKKATLTFGKRTDLDYNKMHDVLDSVNITSSKVWAKVKIENEWKELSKDIVLE